MMRLLLIIFFFFSSAAVMAHSALLYRMAATEAIIAEEETTDHKPLLKAANEIGAEQIGFCTCGVRQAAAKTILKAALHPSLLSSEGFYDTPYNPPDHS